MKFLTVSLAAFLFFSAPLRAQKREAFHVVAYYGGSAAGISQFAVQDLTDIIYSFLHLRNGRLSFGNDRQKEALRALAALKSTHPNLKILVSLGGWGGCYPCSESFSTDTGRQHFALSVKEILDEYQVDGIDLDWEYPAIEGVPGHPFKAEDRDNFTALVRKLRLVLGNEKLISFAAGGFPKYLEESIDWTRAMPYVDFVNLMTYDLVNGNTPHTGHLTALYSTSKQIESTDYCINWLLKKGIPSCKLVIGAAFYARVWKNVPPKHHGLYQPGKFSAFISYRKAADSLFGQNGFRMHYDRKARASYSYNRKTGDFATFDDPASIRRKTRYAYDRKLGGLMFWELTLDKPEGGLLEVITRTLQEETKR